jgi:hypothetical protein
MIYFSIITKISEILKNRGWKWKPTKNRRGLRGIEVLEGPRKQGTILVPGIVLSQTKNNSIQEQIEKYFEDLKKEIQRQLPLKIRSVIFQGGGVIPIPKDFRDWCKQMGIEIVVFYHDNKNLKDQLKKLDNNFEEKISDNLWNINNEIKNCSIK